MKNMENKYRISDDQKRYIRSQGFVYNDYYRIYRKETIIAGNNSFKIISEILPYFRVVPNGDNPNNILEYDGNVFVTETENNSKRRKHLSESEIESKGIQKEYDDAKSEMTNILKNIEKYFLGQSLRKTLRMFIKSIGQTALVIKTFEPEYAEEESILKEKYSKLIYDNISRMFIKSPYDYTIYKPYVYMKSIYSGDKSYEKIIDSILNADNEYVKIRAKASCTNEKLQSIKELNEIFSSGINMSILNMLRNYNGIMDYINTILMYEAKEIITSDPHYTKSYWTGSEIHNELIVNPIHESNFKETFSLINDAIGNEFIEFQKKDSLSSFILYDKEPEELKYNSYDNYNLMFHSVLNPNVSKENIEKGILPETEYEYRIRCGSNAGSIKPFPVNVPISFDYICQLLFDEVCYKTSDEIKLENNSKISHTDEEPVAANYKNRILIK